MRVIERRDPERASTSPRASPTSSRPRSWPWPRSTTRPSSRRSSTTRTSSKTTWTMDVLEASLDHLVHDGDDDDDADPDGDRCRRRRQPGPRQTPTSRSSRARGPRGEPRPDPAGEAGRRRGAATRTTWHESGHGAAWPPTGEVAGRHCRARRVRVPVVLLGPQPVAARRRLGLALSRLRRIVHAAPQGAEGHGRQARDRRPVPGVDYNSGVTMHATRPRSRRPPPSVGGGPSPSPARRSGIGAGRRRRFERSGLRVIGVDVHDAQVDRRPVATGRTGRRRPRRDRAVRRPPRRAGGVCRARAPGPAHSR